MKKILTIILVLLTIVSCNKTSTLSINLPVKEDNKFDGVFATIAIEDFKNEGFDYGDSVDVFFSNGIEFKDLPFYSGFYVKKGEPLLVGYKGYEYIEITRASGGLWKESGLKETDSVTIVLNQKAKYLNEEETFSLKYSNNINDYDLKEEFANYREMIGGKLKDNLLYRGATPINNVYNRALIVNELIEKDGIKFVIDLSDSEEDFINNMNEELTDSYINKLYENNRILFLGLGADYSTKDYGQKVVQAFTSIINEEGHIYIHCIEGKDRTGFVCLLLEALVGFSEEEILNDYMKTYDNYYGINPSTNLKSYNAIKNVYYDSFINYLNDLEQGSKKYLLDNGMSQDDLNNLINKLTK